MSRTLEAILILLTASVLISPAHAAENDRYARVVLFIQEDAEAPKNHLSRLNSLAERTESLIGKWMKHWNYPIERSTIFARTEAGSVEVTVVKGKLTNANGRAALPELRSKAIEGASKKLGIKPNEEVVWWILYDYPGVKGFQGGARKFGGVAINAYPPGVDPIDKEVDLASPKLSEMAIKGTIHEFGHALGLPHIGPLPNAKLGNTLMGPINKAFWKKTDGQDTRVYLSNASAAALWKHPIFRKEATASPKMPKKVTVADLNIVEGAEGKKVTISGKVTASVPAHTALVLDSERSKYGDYWERPYIAKVDAKTGAFEITIDEPFAKGTIFLSFCFKNGTNTSDGQLPFQRGSTHQISYETKEGKRQFDKTPKAGAQHWENQALPCGCTGHWNDKSIPETKPPLLSKK